MDERFRAVPHNTASALTWKRASDTTMQSSTSWQKLAPGRRLRPHGQFRQLSEGRLTASGRGHDHRPCPNLEVVYRARGIAERTLAPKLQRHRLHAHIARRECINTAAIN
jgi:hypothetical protein